MSIKCKLGFHDWTKDFEKCSKCGKIRYQGTFTDTRDGKTYKWIKIGHQTIMAEDLAYKPNDGTFWAYDNDQVNVSKYGYLYNWETAKTVAPKGWHLPTKDEFETLCSFLGGDNKFVFNAIKEGGNSSFNALLGGCRSTDGAFNSIGTNAYFWSATAYRENQAWALYCFGEHRIAGLSQYPSSCGFWIRLFRDSRF